MTTPTVTAVSPSREELASGQFTQESLQKCVDALHRDGVVVLDNVIPTAETDALNAHMLNETRVLVNRGKDGPYNYNLGNLQQDPPFSPEWFFPSIFLNPLATQVSGAYLGGKPVLSFISGNTAVKVEGNEDDVRDALKGQPVHSDISIKHPDVPFSVVVNVGLIDMTPESGSTEVWVGTHTNSGLHQQTDAQEDHASGLILPELLDARRLVMPPIQPFVRKGSLIMRDPRLWHAGRPNHNTNPRIMLACTHFAPWHNQGTFLHLPVCLKPVFMKYGKDLDVNATWSDEVNGKFGVVHPNKKE